MVSIPNENPNIETIIQNYVRVSGARHPKFSSQYQTLGDIFISKVNVQDETALSSFDHGSVSPRTREQFQLVKRQGFKVSQCFGYEVLRRFVEPVLKAMLHDSATPLNCQNVMSAFESELENALQSKNPEILQPSTTQAPLNYGSSSQPNSSVPGGGNGLSQSQFLSQPQQRQQLPSLTSQNSYGSSLPPSTATTSGSQYLNGNASSAGNGSSALPSLPDPQILTPTRPKRRKRKKVIPAGNLSDSDDSDLPERVRVKRAKTGGQFGSKTISTAATAVVLTPSPPPEEMREDDPDDDGKDFFKAEWGEFETDPGTLTGGAKVTWSRNDAGQPIALDAERFDLLKFEAAWNDGDPYRMMRLVELKDIIKAQLPNMPREYIFRQVFDRNHRSLVVMKKFKPRPGEQSDKYKVVGGITARPFHARKLVEIVFYAVAMSEQKQGYGARLMDHLKAHFSCEGSTHFLTCADNFAVGFFQKQGFTKDITLPQDQWVGLIKDYDQTTLMECRLHKGINYLDTRGLLRLQRSCLRKEIKQRTKLSQQIFNGLPAAAPGQAMRPLDIPGLTKELVDSARRHARSLKFTRGAHANMNARFGVILKILIKHKDSRTFREPVDREELAHYYDKIKHPMDFQTMSEKLDNGEYKSIDRFQKDFNLIVSNCVMYNGEGSTYTQCVKKLERLFKEEMKVVIAQAKDTS